VIVFSLVIFVGSLLLSYVLTKFVRDTANAKGWVYVPDSSRHLHKNPVPRLGGVAIFAALHITIVFALVFCHFYPALNLGISAIRLWEILVPGSLIFALGVYDDLRNASPYTKFGIQAIAGAMLFAAGLRILHVPLYFGNYQLSWFVSFGLTVLWVMAISNAFNLIDGLDGLAAGSALFSTIVVGIVSSFSSSHFPLITIALAGAILGFLRFNFNPATIFLGDCGSLFIGFMLSALALHHSRKAPTIVAVAIPMVSFGLPILETGLSVVRRLISGRPVFSADLEHIHHKLLQRGFSHRQVVIVLYGVSAIFALLSLFLLMPGGAPIALVLCVIGIGVWIGVHHLGYLEFRELKRLAHRTMEQRQVLINNIAVRRAAEELKSSKSYDQVWRILEDAFRDNDFDGFDLLPQFLPQQVQIPDLFLPDQVNGRLQWRKHPDVRFETSSWHLTLNLESSNHHHRGYLVLFRQYSDRPLQLDINLLSSHFPVALADAIERSLGNVPVITPIASERALGVAAN
jgi:UDP-GlcNAc:undecaprenyl-phosphate/decaprenyl-phosphate GlcNAc-1-phosphate transferase